MQPDTVEVWNISRLYQPPLPSGSNNDDAIRYWEGWLDRGAKVGATGGSDSHWRSTFAAQGVGQPTTWVFARERTTAGVLEGLRAGRTFISHQPPNLGGPRLFLEAGDKMVGDEVAPGTRLTVRVEKGTGMFLRIVKTGGRQVGQPSRSRGRGSPTRSARRPRRAGCGRSCSCRTRRTSAALRPGRNDLLPQQARRDRHDVRHLRAMRRLLALPLVAALLLAGARPRRRS